MKGDRIFKVKGRLKNFDDFLKETGEEDKTRKSVREILKERAEARETKSIFFLRIDQQHTNFDVQLKASPGIRGFFTKQKQRRSLHWCCPFVFSIDALIAVSLTNRNNF